MSVAFTCLRPWGVWGRIQGLGALQMALSRVRKWFLECLTKLHSNAVVSLVESLRAGEIPVFLVQRKGVLAGKNQN